MLDLPSGHDDRSDAPGARSPAGQRPAAGADPNAVGTPPLLHQSLARWAAERPDRRAFTFLADAGSEESVLTYGELHRRSMALAGALLQAGFAGRPVLLCIPGGSGFVVGFCACLMAGVIAVPLPASPSRRIWERNERIIADSAAVGAILPDGHPMAADLVSRGLILLDPDAAVSRPIPTGIDASSPAFLQYTSGSTDAPKGVTVTHANLAHSVAMIEAAFSTTSDDIGVSWLPLHHDMGLIGSVAHIIHMGMHCIHFSPRAMVTSPIRWLRTIARYRATMSGGPDFAWRLLAERVAPADLIGLDLSQWKVAYTGAEPVHPGTLRLVTDRLSGTGFSERSFLPCYGLAEATLIVSGGPPECGASVATPVGADEGIGYVSCGRPVITDSVAIVDPETRRRRPDGLIGEIAITGPHVTPGYWRDERGDGRFDLEGRRWLPTGDLGFLRHGELHISGRIKDLIIVNGVKHHAEDIEATIRSEVSGCSQGAIATVQIGSGAAAAVWIAIELTRQSTDEAELARQMSAAVWRRHGLRLHRLIMDRTGGLPRTSSGKIRRAAIRERIEAGVYTAAVACP
jgi:acyl-CoA synthetase (AMP-forming)/AMP-acid ligase II